MPPNPQQVAAFVERFAKPGPPAAPEVPWPAPPAPTYLEALNGAIRDLFTAVTRLERMAYFDLPKSQSGGPVLASWPGPGSPPDKTPPPPPPSVPPV
jgi:hypothetical protein